MMKYLLDTNILRHYTDGHQTLLNNLAKVPLEQIAVPFIVFAEQMRGRYDALLKAEPQDLLREQERLIGTQAVLSAFSILYLDQPSVKKLIELRQKHSTRKRYADTIIAAMALAGGHVIITRNIADFSDLLPAVKIQNWLDQVY
ncbi:MAG TPA: PIN domain-containing protein [Blastocatellia bacterium]|jgi:predicted nucleic acid-binding protein|nr:PIN domain-containing protein [Blastocatellia bacterium]